MSLASAPLASSASIAGRPPAGADALLSASSPPLPPRPVPISLPSFFSFSEVHQKRPQAVFGATVFPCAMFLGCRISKLMRSVGFSPIDLFLLATNSGGGGGTGGIGTDRTGGSGETGGAAWAFAEEEC